jgi:ABC-type antimicrobial peptide transport system permease subunit
MSSSFDHQYAKRDRLYWTLLNLDYGNKIETNWGVPWLLFDAIRKSIPEIAKEIGIRKVLGASVAGLAALLSKDFLQLVALSCLIAFPLAWGFVNYWLKDFAFHTTVHWWIFALAGTAAFLIALLTVSSLAIKAALMNPVETLRAE